MDLVMDPFVWFFWVPYSPLSNSRKSIWQTSQVMSRKSCLISCSILSFYRHSWETSLYQPYIPPPSHFLWHLHNFTSLNSPFKVYNRFAQARVHPAAHVHPKTVSTFLEMEKLKNHYQWLGHSLLFSHQVAELALWIFKQGPWSQAWTWCFTSFPQQDWGGCS